MTRTITESFLTAAKSAHDSGQTMRIEHWHLTF